MEQMVGSLGLVGDRIFVIQHGVAGAGLMFCHMVSAWLKVKVGKCVLLYAALLIGRITDFASPFRPPVCLSHMGSKSQIQKVEQPKMAKTFPVTW